MYSIKIRKLGKRDGLYCKHCLTTEELTVDHIKPKSLGGTGKMENLQLLCRTCNMRKGSHYEEPKPFRNDYLSNLIKEKTMLPKRPWSDQFEAYCQKIGKWPVMNPPPIQRSRTIEEELEKLRQDYKAFPDKRWHITQRATMLKSAQAKLAGHPLPSKQLTDEEFVSTTEFALS